MTSPASQCPVASYDSSEPQLQASPESSRGTTRSPRRTCTGGRVRRRTSRSGSSTKSWCGG